MADGLGTPGGVVSDEDHRIANAGLIAPQTSTLDVRTGVLLAPGSTALVTGTSATGTMTYAIAAHHAVTSRGAADGVYLGPTLEAATTVTTTPAPGANSRIDVIWVKQNDTASSVTPDTGSTAPVYGVTQGTAAAAPTKPTIPVGAAELATAVVAAGATSTGGAGVTITNTARQTVARGAPIPVRTQAERDALTTFPNLVVSRLDLGTLEVRNAANTAWQTVAYSFPPAEITAYRNTTTHSIAATGTTTVVLDASEAGSAGLTLNTGTGSVTVSAGNGGTYEVSAMAAVRELASTDSRMFASIYVNGVERIRGLDITRRSGGSPDQSGSPLPARRITLAAADVVTLRIFHDGVAAADLLAGQAVTWMQLRRVA